MHRDVKPQNVLVDEEGSAKVTDFGIARSMDDSGLTAEGRVLGTTDYVSPEQALGHDVNGQSDIYSLGIVLYEMLTGDVPFHGENQVSVAMKHVREDLPDVSKRRPEVSAGLAAILDRMTSKDLRKRYPDALSLQADLEEALARELSRTGQSTGEATAVLRTLPESARRRLPLRMRRPLPIVAIIALLAAAAALDHRADQGGRRPHPARHRPGHGQARARHPRRLGQAHLGDQAFDPAGDDEEHGGEAPLAVDKDPGTDWTHRGLQRRQPRQGGRRHLRRRRSRASTRARSRSTRPIPAGRRRSASPTAPARRRRSAAGRRSPAAPSTPSASASASTATATATTWSGSPASRPGPSA